MDPVQHVQGDLFESVNNNDEQFALCHCVSADFSLGKGIALTFRERYGRVAELVASHCPVGGCVPLSADPANNQPLIYNLVTKQYYYGKPTLKTLKSSLEAMKRHALANGITTICMPRIGCGLDRLNWNDVEAMLVDMFTTQEGIKIKVFTK